MTAQPKKENDEDKTKAIRENDSSFRSGSKSNLKNSPSNLTNLDEFEGLWELTEEQSQPISSEEHNKIAPAGSNLQEIIYQQQEEILYLREVNELLSSEKLELDKLVNQLKKYKEEHEQAKREHQSIVFFNRKLIKQINESEDRRRLDSKKLDRIYQILQE